MKVDILTFRQQIQRQNNYFDIEVWILKKTHFVLDTKILVADHSDHIRCEMGFSRCPPTPTLEPPTRVFDML